MERFRSRLKRGMSATIRETGMDRDAITQEMARMGAPISRSMLDAYTSEAKTDHDISVVRFKALIRALDAPALWDLAVSDEGLIILQGDEARLAEIARLQQEQRLLAARLKKLRSVPVNVKALSAALSADRERR